MRWGPRPGGTRIQCFWDSVTQISKLNKTTKMHVRLVSGNQFIHTKDISDYETLQELRMLSTVTLDCQVTKIVMNSGKNCN